MNELNASLETSKPNNQPNSQADNNGVKQTSNAPNKQPDNKVEKPRSLAEIFADPTDETNTEMYLGDDTPDDPNAPIDSIDRLMKRHKLTPEQAYAIKVPMPDGAEALTIGQIKDKVADLSGFEMRVTQFDDRRIKQEGQLIRSQQELKGILEMLPKEALKPEVLQKVRERQDAVVRRERQATLEHIPEWRDESTRTKELEGIVETLGDYGFDGNFLDSIVDHRAMKLVRDFHLMRSRIRKSLEAVRDPKKLGMKPSAKGAKPAIKPNNNQPSTRRNAVATQDDKLRNWFQSKES